MASKALPSPEVLRQLLRYEPETGKLFWKPRTPDMFTSKSYSAERECRRWNSRFSGAPALATLMDCGYFRGCIGGNGILAHRAIWAITTGQWPQSEIDHINGIRSDNRLVNLRSASRDDNAKNIKTPAANRSGVIGVFYRRSSGKWIANIMANGKQMHLGSFSTISEAALSRSNAEIKYGYHPNHGRK